MKLPDATIVCPGHGDDSTIGDEKKHNPYITGRA
jgi:hydroxyacylglutathione hydrolase